MYSKELEDLISAALTDGVITDKERQVLHRKAQAEGVDPDELDMILDSRLQKLQQTQKPKESYNETYKCPHCGAIVGKMDAKCPECGNEISRSANSSAKELATKIEQISEHHNWKTETPAFKHEVEVFVANFPIPNNKEDLFEFLTYLRPYVDEKNPTNGYTTKYKQCLNKAQTLYRNEEPIKSFLDKEEKSHARRKQLIKIGAIAAAALVVFIIVMCFVTKAKHTRLVSTEEARQEALVAEIESLIDQGKFDKAECKAREIVFAPKGWRVEYYSDMSGIRKKRCGSYGRYSKGEMYVKGEHWCDVRHELIYEIVRLKTASEGYEEYEI